MSLWESQDHQVNLGTVAKMVLLFAVAFVSGCLFKRFDVCLQDVQERCRLSGIKQGCKYKQDSCWQPTCPELAVNGHFVHPIMSPYQVVPARAYDLINSKCVNFFDDVWEQVSAGSSCHGR